MSTPPDWQRVQALLFEHLQATLPPHVGLTDAVAAALEVDYSQAYRRVKLKTPVDIGEIDRLTSYFKLPPTWLSDYHTGQAVAFRPAGVRGAVPDLSEYLRQMLGMFQDLQRQQPRYGLFAAKDTPIFHLFAFPELAAFKLFFWRKTNFGDAALLHAQFDPGSFQAQQAGNLELCRQLAAAYARTPTYELWHDDTLASYVKQIGYYYRAGFFAAPQMALGLCDALASLFEHLRNQARLGAKFLPGKADSAIPDSFRLYHNDIVSFDNTLYLELPAGAVTYTTYNLINYMHTRDAAFCAETSTWLRTLLERSMLVSTTGEAQRNAYFARVMQALAKLRAAIVRDLAE